MYYSVGETINEMRTLIKEAEEIKVLVENLNRKINTLRQTTFIGEVVKFNGVRQDKDVLENSLIELDSIIKTQAQLDKLDILYEKENEQYLVGDLLIANRIIKVLNIPRISTKRVIDINGYREFDTGAEFVIVDIKGSEYILKPSNNHVLLIATESQVKTFFDKSPTGPLNNVYKVEFSLNGVHPKFIRDLREIKLYVEKARERVMNSFYYATNYKYNTNLLDVSYDETFGTMGTMYIETNADFLDDVNKLQDVILRFDDKFAVGFSRKQGSVESFKYNGKISYFTKEPGKYGEHFFPKDVFISKQRERIFTILDVKHIVQRQENESEE